MIHLKVKENSVTWHFSARRGGGHSNFSKFCVTWFMNGPLTVGPLRPRWYLVVLENTVISNTNLFSKLTQMLPKKAKMTFWWLDVGGTLIRTRSFCSPGHCLVAKNFTRPLYISKKTSDALKLRKSHFYLLAIA